MPPPPSACLLTINPGSSSLKAGLFEAEGAGRQTLAAEAERIALPGSRLRATDSTGVVLFDDRADLPDHGAALRAFLAWLRERGLDARLCAIGYRIVHGGVHHSEPQIVTPALLADLRQLATVDPDHVPQALALIRLTGEAYPAIPQVACFDTAFHRSMPRLAQIYALPRRLSEAGLVRYGFHGLSCEFIANELRAIDPATAGGRAIVAHLGSGASLTAILAGRSMDTTMGFSPAGGIMMGTRSGDLDPGIFLYLMQGQGLDAAAMNNLVNREAGLLGVSGDSHDVRDLLDREATDPHAAEAIALFCYIARKFLGALVAVLGGLDVLVFTAGIGEHAATVRQRICAGFEYLGLELDTSRNARNAPVVSTDGGRVVVRVMKTDEALMIARHTRRLVLTKDSHHV